MQMRWTWRVGRIAGIEIAIHPSWLVTYALFAWWLTIAAQYMPGSVGGASAIALGLVASFALFVSIVVHEFSHALVARRLGIPIGNITLFLFGGVASILREPGTPLDEFKMAGAGPAMSLAIAAVFGGLFDVFAHTGWAWGATLCGLLALANVGIALFNLLPMFPSDGGRLLRALLWRIIRSQARATGVASIVSMCIAGALIVAGVYLAVVQHYTRGLWWAIIGLFLAQAAFASARQARLGLALERMRVGDCMERRLMPVSADATLATFLSEVSPHLQRTGYPVVSNGAIVGLVTLGDTALVPPSLWSGTSVSEVMTPAAESPPIRADAPASDALVALARSPAHTLPVYEDGVLAGVVSEETIFGALRSRDRALARAS